MLSLKKKLDTRKTNISNLEKDWEARELIVIINLRYKIINYKNMQIKLLFAKLRVDEIDLQIKEKIANVKQPDKYSQLYTSYFD